MNIEKVGVVGCGLMGAGIVQTVAQAGYTTIVRELNEEFLKKGLGHVNASLDKGVERKKLTQEKRDSIWACIQGTTNLADLADCDLVIEVIFEDLKAKQELFKELDSICKKETIFASNTSSLSIAAMASVTQRPDRVAGLHYFFPSLINQLLEVVWIDQSAPEVIETLRNFARITGKIPIVVKDAPGFAVNRFFVPWVNEGARLLDEGVANIPTIDKGACESFKVGMGPFAIMNATQVHTTYNCTVTFSKSMGAFYGAADVLTAQVKAGKPWDLAGEAEDKAHDFVGDRLMGVVFGIAAQLVEEGVASVEDIERAALIGLRWVKGPFAMMNDIGLDRALDLVEKIAARHDSFPVAEVLKKQAASGQPWLIKDVRLEVKDTVATITMNRPEAMNALNEKVLKELKGTIAQLREDPSVRAVIVTGEGSAFVSGADIKTMLATDLNKVGEFIRFGQEVMNDVENLNKPVIAAINGYALGGGLELALACDIRLASTDARMGFPEVGLGIFPGFGGTQRTPRLAGKGQACELIFTGGQVSAEEAARVGLVNRVVSPKLLMSEAWKLAQRIAQQGPIAVSQAKQVINLTFQTDLNTGLISEFEGVLKTFGTEDQKEGMKAFTERRKPEFKGQ